MVDVDLQLMFHTKALVGRFYKRKKKGKIGFAKVLVPDGEVDRALSQDSSVSGRKLRVVRWDGGPVGPRPGCTIRLLRLPPVESGPNIEAAVRLFEIVKFQVRPVDGYICEQWLDKGASVFCRGVLGCPRGLQKSLRGQQLYSHVAVDKTAETRMKSMETAMYDMRRLLERLKQAPSN